MTDVFEKEADSTLLLLSLLGEDLGLDADGNVLYGPLVITDAGQPAPPLTPLAPTILATSNMPTRTSATINWSASPNPDSRPAVTSYRVLRDSVVVGTVSGTTLTFSESGLPTSTPELVFVYTVVPVSSEGQGDASPPLSLQWQGTVVTVPSAPTGFGKSSMTLTTVDLFWSETTDTSVDKHGLFEGSTLVQDNISAAARTFHWTVPSGSTHTNLSVKRHNTAGWSLASNTITFTNRNSTVVHDPVMGVPRNDEIGSLGIATWPAARSYDFPDAQSSVTAWGCRVIGLTASSTSNTGGQATANALRNFLEGFYYTSTGAPKNTGVEIHWAVGNEIDNKSNFTSGSLPSAYIATVAACYDVVQTKNGDGSRRYPMASMWVDMTQNQINNHGSGPRFKAIAMYLDGMACSMYPPGRDLSKNPPLFNPYPDYCDAVFAVLDDWHTTYPNCNQFATWEFGIPIDHAFYSPTGTKDSNGYGTAQTDYTVRPRYVGGGITAGGKDWLGFLQYTYNACDSIGVSMREQIYWNQSSDPTKPNKLKWDKQPLTTPDTEHAWHDWTPGSRLPHG